MRLLTANDYKDDRRGRRIFAEKPMSQDQARHRSKLYILRSVVNIPE
jgi:hypothetical protein